MPNVETISDFLGKLAPLHLAEDWDNVGLLVGDRRREVGRIMACLTITPATAAEAVERRVDLIVAHHPLPFIALKRLTNDTTVGRLLLDLIGANVSIYSAHTAFDSAAEGINQRLAAGLGLRDVKPLIPRDDAPGAGRYGTLAEPMPLGKLAQRLCEFLHIKGLQLVGDESQTVRTVAIGCGAADEFLATARETRCDAMVLGEARFHACLEAEASGIGLLLPGHFASERFGVETLAATLAAQFPELEVWASREEQDPIRWIG